MKRSILKLAFLALLTTCSPLGLGASPNITPTGGQGALTPTEGQGAIPTRTVTGTSTTIVTADDNSVILHTGAAATYTLGSVSDGFSCTISNHGTGNITFSAAVTTANGQTITVLSPSSGEIVPGQIGNSITLLRIGGVWRSI